MPNDAPSARLGRGAFMTDGSGTDFGGVLWVAITILGPLLLAGAFGYGVYQTVQRRRRTGASLDARRASPAEAFSAGGERRSSGTYLMRLGIPVAAAVVLIVVVVTRYI